ncbi:MAG TPA: SufE family protein [Tepidiformaceae bacterium]|nr:SufE family protein [Tepidiformaceae bacterium]
MATIPPALQSLVEDFEFADRSERIDLLIEYADRFVDVPERIATRPFPAEVHVERCESDAYIWAEDLPDGTIKYHFAVENPQGLSAKAWAVIMDETLSGQPLEQVAEVPCELVFTVFGKDVSMGKGMGLMGMTDMVTAYARQRLKARKAGE